MLQAVSCCAKSKQPEVSAPSREELDQHFKKDDTKSKSTPKNPYLSTDTGQDDDQIYDEPEDPNPITSTAQEVIKELKSRQTESKEPYVDLIEDKTAMPAVSVYMDMTGKENPGFEPDRDYANTQSSGGILSGGKQMPQPYQNISTENDEQEGQEEYADTETTVGIPAKTMKSHGTKPKAYQNISEENEQEGQEEEYADTETTVGILAKSMKRHGTKPEAYQNISEENEQEGQEEEYADTETTFGILAKSIKRHGTKPEAYQNISAENEQEEQEVQYQDTDPIAAIVPGVMKCYETKPGVNKNRPFAENNVEDDEESAHDYENTEDFKKGVSPRHENSQKVKSDMCKKSTRQEENITNERKSSPDSPDYQNTSDWTDGIQPPSEGKKNMDQPKPGRAVQINPDPNTANSMVSEKYEGKGEEGESYENVSDWTVGIQPDIRVPDHERERDKKPPQTLPKPQGKIQKHRTSIPAKTNPYKYENTSIEKNPHELKEKLGKRPSNLAEVHSTASNNDPNKEFLDKLKTMRSRFRMQEDEIYDEGVVGPDGFKTLGSDESDLESDTGIKPPTTEEIIKPHDPSVISAKNIKGPKDSGSAPKSDKPPTFACGNCKINETPESYVNVPASGQEAATPNDKSSTSSQHVDTTKTKPIIPPKVVSRGKGNTENAAPPAVQPSPCDAQNQETEGDIYCDDVIPLKPQSDDDDIEDIYEDDVLHDSSIKTEATEEETYDDVNTVRGNTACKNNEDDNELVYGDTAAIKHPSEEEEEEEAYFENATPRESVGPILPETSRIQHEMSSENELKIKNKTVDANNNAEEDPYEAVEFINSSLKETTSNSPKSKSLPPALKQKPTNKRSKSTKDVSRKPQPLPKTGKKYTAEISKSAPNLTKIGNMKGNTAQRKKLEICGAELNAAVAHKRKNLKTITF